TQFVDSVTPSHSNTPNQSHRFAPTHRPRLGDRSQRYTQERAPNFFGTTSHPRHTFEINALPVCAI
ncbi:MAG: hypothetical protein J0H25_10400, partial [Rhizobiales bacterium]|nr:hypothetical protein [Hyphomicrobiales bacterium]